MTDNAPTFIGSMTEFYDKNLGPVLFSPYADDIAARAKFLKPANVLELAAGTGIVSRSLRSALPKHTDILCTDFSEDMLKVARAKFKNNENIQFNTMDAMSIPHGDETYDVLVSQFGVMFFPDKVASYREALRVLKPGGTYLASAWGSWDEVPWAQLAHETVAEFFEGEPPGFYKIPFHYSDIKQIQSNFESAGFADVKVEKVTLAGALDSHRKMADGAIFGNPIANEIMNQPGDVTPEQVRDAVEQALERAFGPAPTTMPLVAYVITARKAPAKKGFFARLFGG